MSEPAEPRINPDPPYAPGTPEPPDLDVDVEQFLDEDERRRSEQDEPGDEPSS